MIKQEIIYYYINGFGIVKKTQNLFNAKYIFIKTLLIH